MIMLFDSEYCNLGSAVLALNKLEFPYIISKNINDLNKKITLVILPGVASYDAYVNSLKKYEFFQKMKQPNFQKNINVLGICSGAQILFESSEEGSQEGIGLLPGKVRKISPKNNILLPHIGWNNVKVLNKESSSIYIDQEKPFYFCHSYRFPDSKNTVAYTDYGEVFPSIVSDGQVTALQFHPEKSYSQGLELLKSIISRSHVKTKNNTSIATV